MGESGFRSRILVSFNFQSEDIKFPDWISLITLCLAPLVAHIIIGIPQLVILDNSLPRWHDRLALYNPTTIMWRYFAIIDRRIRSKYKTWTPLDLAATNHIFWTANGWDGSESMMFTSRQFCVEAPQGRTTKLFSSDTVKTLIVGLQGVQAIHLVTESLKGHKGSFSSTLALDKIFTPLAIFGLVRLPAALWLTKQGRYASIGQATLMDHPSPYLTSIVASSTSSMIGTPKPFQAGQTPLLSKPDDQIQITATRLEPEPERFHSPRGVRGICVRVLYLIPLLGLFGMTVHLLAPRKGEVALYSATNFLTNILYLTLLTCSLFILGWIFARDIFSANPASNTTVIPCISSPFYKIYTMVLMAMMAGVFIVACLETRKTPCGTYTTKQTADDRWSCPGGFYVNASDSSGPFGVVSRSGGFWTHPDGSNATTGRKDSNPDRRDIPKGNMDLFPLTGFCQGILENSTVVTTL